MGDPHGDQPHPLAPAHVAVDVERHGLVLRLLQRVPHEQRPHAVVADLGTRLGHDQQGLRQRGGVVLEGGGEGQVQPLVVDALTVAEQPADVGADGASRVAELFEPVVEHPVLASVHLLLTEEPFDVLLEGGIGDPILGAFDGTHEVVLTVREHRRRTAST